MSIPSNIRVPYFYVNFDPTRAVSGPSLLKYKVLIMGQKLSTGTKEALKLNLVRNPDEANKFYGAGSQIARMFEKWFANTNTVEVYGMSIVDLPAGVKSSGDLTVSGTAASSSIFPLRVNGKRVNVGILADDNASAIADKIVTEVNANSLLPVTATNDAGVITFTAKNAGINGNDLDISVNFSDDAMLPDGVSTDVDNVEMEDGDGNPDITDILDKLGDEWFHMFVCPWTDNANLTALEAELDDRFGPIRMIDGIAYIGKRGSVGDLNTFGSTRNSPHVTCKHCQAIPESPEEFATAVCAQEASSSEVDPARPFQTLPLRGITAPDVIDRFNWQDNNSLLFSGISTFYVDNGNVVRIQRSITMYSTNPMGAPDTAYLDTNTMVTLMYLRFDFRNTFLTKYPRAKLANDGVRLPSNQQILTPKFAKSEAINIFKTWQEDLGLVEDIEQFKEDLVVERDASDPNRLNFLLSPNLINQFRVGAGTIQFLL